ncbi:lasso peptide biosynthesis B2 protein [Tardiphaga alba]|uniref:Lasso peptide biosynthesis B2 protein n=1 Tax=Tardiphaga alba TaxID=340268 RepID=A0ABX8A378_9BRAD|nr:lasso peptide biosynthesis B2 protein [Tardiphaga alba]QUS37857.1 lasso peptide biosynthesis B2 protein [Tardiphaga alba]
MSAVVLSLSHFSTKLLGIDRTVRMFHWVGERMRAGARAGDLSAQTIAARALQGLNVLPMRIECLDQAIVVWFSLNRHGHPATLRIGMRLSPLSGHAWVTCGTDMFVTTPGMEDFTVVATYDPWPGLSLQQSEPA